MLVRLKSRDRWIVFSVVLLGIFLTFYACRPRAGKNDLERIVIAQWGQEKYLIYLPVYVAMERGYLADEGLEASLKFTGNDDQTFAAVVQGAAQFGIGDPAFAAISRERGLKSKVIATVVGGVAIWGLTNKPMSPITEVGDLAGLRVGTFPSPSTNYTLMAELKNRNPDLLADMEIVQAPIGSQIALLEAGQADIAMELEPAASISESKGYRVVYSSPRFHGPYAFTGVTVLEEFTKSHKDVVQRFIRALERATVDCHRKPELPIEVAVQLFPTLDRSVARRAVKRMLDEGTFPQHVAVAEEAWQRTLETRLLTGDLSRPQETSETVDNSFAITAQSALDR